MTSPFDAVLFDMDGVLIDAAPIHRRAFASAVEQVTGRVLTPEDNARLEARPTKVKLEMLGIVGKPAAEVFRRKQAATLAEAKAYPRDEERADYLAELLRVVPPVSVVTNSINETAVAFLLAAGFPYHRLISASDGLRPKPAPDLYRLAARTCDVHPSRCLVFEDSPVGVEAARQAGCVVWPTTFETLPSHLDCLLRLLR